MLTATLGDSSAPLLAVAAETVEPDYTFVSMPDFLNQDVADLGQSPCATWEQGDPIGTTLEYEIQLDRVLDEIASEGPDDVFVAGDMFEARWGEDDEDTGIFGPVVTYLQRVEAVQRAACTYYPVWKQRFADHELSPLTAIGDHEIGDGHWNINTDGPRARFKHRAHSVFKRQWVEFLRPHSDNHPAKGQARWTAYGVMLHPEVLLLTVQTFRRTQNDVLIDVDRAQLRWLRANLERAKQQGVDWVIVQGHVPVLGPVRQSRSSWPPLRWEKGVDNTFWQTLQKYDVDIFLTGERHATTVKRAGGVTQITHGGRFYAAEVSYIVGRVYGDRMVLESRAFDARVVENGEKIWQTDRRVGKGGVEYSSESHRTGYMALTKEGDSSGRSGLFAPYDGTKS